MENVVKCEICKTNFNLEDNLPCLLKCGNTLCMNCVISKSEP